MAVFDDVILQSTLEIDKRQYLVTLTSNRILLEAGKKKKENDDANVEVSYRSVGESIDLREIIAARLEKPPAAKDKVKTTEGNKVYLCIEMRPLKPNSFSIYYIKRMPKHRWRHKQLTLMSPEFETCQIWVDRIQDRLDMPEFQRPKSLLVFINPFGGKKRAPKIYKEKVSPLFKLAGIRTDNVVTTNASHAYDVLQDYDLSRIDGVVAVGGDGTFSELMNGLLARSNGERGINRESHHEPVKPQLRIGIIPAGSTDAVVYTTTGINDPVTSALHIIVGDRVGIDVCALYNNDRFLKYSVTMMAYGFYGDVLEDSEAFRWMGPKRYNWSGFKKVLTKKSYDGEVSYLLSDESAGHPQVRAHCWSG
ncbi:ceramide kinase-like [Gigantopelta aegis]|uniref:ceramide kinase-like n=1 Tax=Gigantopelta aegis TaxID=1735272 RepID=UPI001B889A27|nr:ceramide kinase-like [Gigantopelta aegis]